MTIPNDEALLKVVEGKTIHRWFRYENYELVLHMADLLDGLVIRPEYYAPSPTADGYGNFDFG